MSGLLTGSRAYGSPTEESDWDLVVLVTKEEAKALAKAFNGSLTYDSPGEPGQGTQLEVTSQIPFPSLPHVESIPVLPPLISSSIKIGSLNLLLVTSKAQLSAWQAGTEWLKSVGPVGRDEAVSLFTKLRETL